jgi:hypothetical protein
MNEINKKPDEDLRGEMQGLKLQLEYLKKDRNSEDLNYFNELHYKIRDL